MRVIHGIWARGALCLWAEDPGLPRAAGSAPGPGRPSRAPGPHPIACQPAELADLLAGLPGPAGEAVRKAVRKAVDDELTLQLPSAGDPPAPLASPELIRPEAPGSASAGPARPGRVSLASWRVPALAFAPAAALDLLGAVGHLGDLTAVAGGSRTPAHLPMAERYVAALTTTDARLDVVTPQDEAEVAELAGLRRAYGPRQQRRFASPRPSEGCLACW